METGLGKGAGLPSAAGATALPAKVGTSCGEGKPLCQQFLLTRRRHGPRSGRHGGALVAQRTGPEIATPSRLRRSRARAGSGSRPGGLRRAVVRMSREPVRWGAASLREGGPPADDAVPPNEPLRHRPGDPTPSVPSLPVPEVYAALNSSPAV